MHRSLEDIAWDIYQTYTLEEILEMNDLSNLEVIKILLDLGLIDTEVPVVLDFNEYGS